MNGEVDYKAKYEETSAELMQLRYELDQLKRLIYGSKSERFVPEVPDEQQSLDFGEQEEPAPQPLKQLISYERKKQPAQKPSGRLPLPADLPREKIIIEPEQDVTGWKKIGEEVTESLEHKPGKLYVKQFVRPKYAAPKGEGVVIGEAPARPIEKCMAGPSLLALILVEKYVDHLPVYRQLQRLKREGVKLPSSTINDWVTGVCKLLDPLYDALRSEVLASSYLQADETTLRVLDKQKKGTTHQGYHWAYHAPLLKLIFFDYQPGRGREGPNEVLKNYTGYLQTDGYKAYDVFDQKTGIQLMHCMAHARRMFYDAQDNDQAKASYALERMQGLYEVEDYIREKELSEKEALQIRQEKAVPVLQELEDWMKETYPGVPPKSPIGKAIAYSLQRWAKLSLYATDGSLQIDNNRIENAIRPIALGRKNYLFAGSHEGAKRNAMMYSFFGSCKMQDINPYDWLFDVLERIPTQSISKIAELLPHNWDATKNS